MQNDVSTDHCDCRDRVVAFLAFLSSDECLAACRRYVAPEPLAEALCRLWFDEIYVPGTAYLDSLKGDRNEEAVRRFEACFTKKELAELERFHGFLGLRIDMAVNRTRGRAAFPDNESWHSIRKHAAYLLEELAPDPERLRQGLTGLVEALVNHGGGDSQLGAARVRALLGGEASEPGRR